MPRVWSLMACLLVTCWAAAASTPFTWLSRPPLGGGGNFSVVSPRVTTSDDGRYVVFCGQSYGWYGGDTGGTQAIWLRDRGLNQTFLLSKAPGGAFPDGWCEDPMISGDGSTVVFRCSASNIITGEMLNTGIVVCEVGTTKYERIDVLPDGSGNTYPTARHPCISDDGRYVLFGTNGPGLVPGDNDDTTMDLFVRDRVAKTTVQANLGRLGQPGTGNDPYPEYALSGNGKRVVFTSTCGDMDPLDPVAGRHVVYVHDLREKWTYAMSELPGGSAVGGYQPSISDDGNCVAFCSPVAMTSKSDPSGNWDVFIRRLNGGGVIWASAPAGGSGAGHSETGWGANALSDDGRFLVYWSNDPRTIGSSTPWPKRQVVRFDRVTGKNTLLSGLTATQLANNDCDGASLSGNGDWVHFVSRATNLVPEDNNDGADVFARRAIRHISGRITLEAGGFLPGASILVKGLDGGGTEYWVHSGPDGIYHVTGLTLGNYSITAFKAGYVMSPPSRTVSLGDSMDSQWFKASPGPADGVRRFRALLVGIENYPTGGDLQYCLDDARELRRMLLTAEGWLDTRITLLLGAQATLNNLKAALLTLGQGVDADDVCLFHYSGHGDQEPDVEPLDEADALDESITCVDERGLTDDVFGHLMNQFRTQNYVTTLDCCYGGGQITGAAAQRAEAGGMQVRSSQVNLPGDGLFADNWWQLPGQLMTQDLKELRTGAVLAATSGSLLSYEYYRLGHGVFSYYLMQGMRGRNADLDDDGALSCGELMTFAAPRTTNYVKSQGNDQLPQAYYGPGMKDLQVIGPLQTPDLMVAAAGLSFYGNNVYSNGEEDQHAYDSVAVGKAAVFRIKLQNESRRSETHTLKGTGPNDDWKVKYTLDGKDVTVEMAGTGLVLRNLPANAEKLITLTVIPKTSKAPKLDLAVTAILERVTSHRDCVMASVSLAPGTAAALVTSLLAAETGTGSEIALHLAQDAALNINLTNIAGIPIRTLVTGATYPAGMVRLAWNRRSDRGLYVPAGTYLVQVTARTQTGEQMRAMTTLTVHR